jgi:hypothetical protein
MKPPTIIISLLCLALGLCLGWSFYLQDQLGHALAQIEQLKKYSSRPVASAPRLPGTPAATAEAKPPTAGPTTAPVVAETKASKKESPLGEMGKGMAKMMSNPAMKDMIASQVRTMVEGEYRDLFDDLELNEEQRNKVFDALTDKLTSSSGSAMQLMSAGDDKAAKETLMKEISAAQDAGEANVKAALGDEKKYETYKRYEDSKPERQQIKLFKNSLGKNGGTPLTQSQEEKLMATLYTERKNFKFNFDYANQQDLNPAKFESGAIKTYQEQKAQFNAKMIENISGFLAPDQTEAFRANQEQMTQMEKMGLDMAESMFGGKKP